MTDRSCFPSAVTSARTQPFWPVLIAVVAGVVYANTLSNGFALDDLPIVRDNPALASPGAFPGFLLEPYLPVGGAANGLYRPVTSTSLWLNQKILGPAPRGYHVVNIFLHMLASVLVWFTVRNLSHYDGTAPLAALLFAVHPLHTEAVANIVGRAEVLGAIFVLAAWLAHCRGRRNPTWSALAALLYLLAFLSKENTVLAPLLFLLDDRLRPGRKQWWTGLPALGGFGVSLGAGMLLRFQALGGLRGAETLAFIDNPAAFGSLGTRWATALWTQVLYARQFLWPQWLSSDYSFDVIPVVRNGTDPRLWAAALFSLVLLGLFVWGCRHSRPIAIAIAAWILFLLPTSNLFFVVGTVMGERLAYLASLGGCLALGHLGASLMVPRADGLSARMRLAALIPLLSLLLVSLSVRTIVRNPAWRDNATLTRADARTYPRSAKLQAGAGIALFIQGELEEAEEAFRRAVEIYPDYGQIQYNLGVMLSNRGANEEAIEHLSRALVIAPHHPGPPMALRELLEKDDLSPEARSRIEALLGPPPS